MNDINIRNLFIDGNKRSSGTPNDFNVLINNNDGYFTTENNEEYYEKIIVIPQKFKILNDFYNISSSGSLVNNQFGIVVSTIINPTNKDAVKFAIPSGYYNVYSLLDWLNENVASELNKLIDFIDTDPTQYTYTFSADYNTDANKYTFNIDVNNNFYNTYYLKFVFEDTTTTAGDLEFSGTCHQFLGCLKNTQLGMDGTDIPSPYTLNFLAYPEIYIYSNIVKNSRENRSEGVISSDLLLTLDNDQPKQSYLNYFSFNDTYQTEVKENIQEFSFRITDKNGTLIDFLTYPLINLTFKKFKIYRDKKTDEILTNILKLNELSILYNKYNSNINFLK